jgi:hypothetical protein
MYIEASVSGHNKIPLPDFNEIAPLLPLKRRFSRSCQFFSLNQIEKKILKLQ